MSLPAILFVVYLVIGVLFWLFQMLSRKNGRYGPYQTGAEAEPAVFWIIILLWPISALLHSAEPDKTKKEEDPKKKEPSKKLPVTRE